MMQRTVGFLFITLFFSAVLMGQDTLPRFTATARGPGKILISWRNNYPIVNQISIQRSTDSLKNFTTLLTVPDPTLPANGAVDSKAPHPNFFYRLFIVLDAGKYVFTPSQRPKANTREGLAVEKEDNDDVTPSKVANPREVTNTREVTNAPEVANPRLVFVQPARNTSERLPATIKSPASIHGMPEMPDIPISATIFVRRGDSLLGSVSGKQILTYRDSLLKYTKDTIVFIDDDTLLIKPFVPVEVYKVSPYVFAGKYGNIHVALPEAAKRHYAIRFFDETNKLLFELTEIKDPLLILDKTNFQHAGWFRFELYDGTVLKEKNKLFIPKEF
jgi:hypothetical protein